MCIDVPSGLIYLFGGWDGAKEMSDFWAFDTALGAWKCISPDTRRYVLYKFI
jgi:hypothetical protein